MKSTLFALLLSLAFQGSASAQLQITYLGEIPSGPYWQHTLFSEGDGNQGILFSYDGPCASSAGHPFPVEGIGIQIENSSSNSITVPYSMSLVCGGSSPFAPEPFIDNFTLNAQIIGDWIALGRPGIWSGTVAIPAGFDSDYCSVYQMQGIINYNESNVAEGSCCVSSGCTFISAFNCAELGGTWTKGGSCDDCEPFVDCNEDIDGDGIPDACDADYNTGSPYAGAIYWDSAVGGNGHWYAILEKPESASEMLQIAQGLGGYVATIGSEAEDVFLRSITQPLFREAVILGGQQIGSTGTFTWVDGSTFDYAAWAPGEPNGSNPSEWISYYENSSNNYQGWHDITFSDSSVTRFAVEWSYVDCNSNGIIDYCENLSDDCENEAEPCRADIDDDGIIGFIDVLIILNDWGACP